MTTQNHNEKMRNLNFNSRKEKKNSHQRFNQKNYVSVTQKGFRLSQISYKVDPDPGYP